MTSFLQIRATIEGKPLFDPPKGDAQSNWLELGQGAVPGCGRLLVRRSDWTAISSVAAPTLRIWQRESDQEWPTTPTLAVPLRVYARTPFVQPRTSDAPDGFVELHVADARFDRAFQAQADASYNVQRAGFPYESGSPAFYAATLNGGSEWTWAQVADALAVGYGGFTFPTVKPRNLAFEAVSQAEATMRLAAILNAAVAFDWQTGASTLMALGTATAANADLWATFGKYPIVDAAAAQADATWPANIRFAFRVAGDVGDPWAPASRWYSKTLPTGYGSGATVRPLAVGYWVAKDTGGSIANTAELDAIAAYLLAANVLGRFTELGDAKQAGIWAFKPDGKFRRVLWTFNAHELTTTVRRNSDVPIRADIGFERRPSPLAIGSAFATRTIDGHSMQADAAFDEEFDAIVTGNSGVGANRWRYAWCSAVLDGDEYVRQDPPERTGTIGNDYAVNGDETGNTATYKAKGLRLDGPDFPPGMKVIAIGSDFEGNLHDVHVRMRRTTDALGNVRYAFNAPNEVDGPCA